MDIKNGTVILGQIDFGWETKTVEINGFPLEVEIADNDQKRLQGLQYRKYLAEDRGILFVFDKPQPEITMHMSNVSFPIAILFINPAGIITQIYKAKPNEKDIKGENVFHVIEVNEEWLDKRGIIIGSKTDLIDDRSIDSIMLRTNVEELPIELSFFDSIFKIYKVNDNDEYIITKDNIVIYQVSDSTEVDILTELFILIFEELLANKELEENTEDFNNAYKDFFKSTMQYFIKESPFVHKEELKRLTSAILQESWDKK